MKIPKDKLPLKIARKAPYGQYMISCNNPKVAVNPDFEDLQLDRKHAGMIVYKDLSNYVVNATNNFEKSIQLLNNCLDILNELDKINWDENSEFQYSSYSDTKEELDEFLQNLENDN